MPKPIEWHALLVDGYEPIRVAQRVRGRASYFDVVFPLLFLHLGHHENFLWSFQVGYTIPTLLVGALLLAMVSGAGRLTPWAALVAGTCLALLPLCGAYALDPPLAVDVGVGENWAEAKS